MSLNSSTDKMLSSIIPHLSGSSFFVNLSPTRRMYSRSSRKTSSPGLTPSGVDLRAEVPSWWPSASQHQNKTWWFWLKAPRARPAVISLVDCPTQPICTWIFICWVTGGYSIQGVVKCLSPCFRQEWALLTNSFCRIYISTDWRRVKSQKLIHRRGKLTPKNEVF